MNADEENFARWERLKIRWSFGHEVEGVVVRHARFGIFLDVDERPRIVGLVLLTDMPPEMSIPRDGRLHLPPIGSRVHGYVLGYRENNLHVALTMLGPPAPRSPIRPGDRVWAAGGATAPRAPCWPT